MKRAAGFGLAIGWLALVVAVYAVLYGIAAFSYTTATKTALNDSAMSAQYRWNGDPLAIKSGGRRSDSSCEVRPDNGPTRPVTPNYPRRFRIDWQPLKPWFSGSATLACSDTVTVYSGSKLMLLKWISVRPVQLAFAVVVAIPFLLVLLIPVIRQGNRQR